MLMMTAQLEGVNSGDQVLGRPPATVAWGHVPPGTYLLLGGWNQPQVDHMD